MGKAIDRLPLKNVQILRLELHRETRFGIEGIDDLALRGAGSHVDEIFLYSQTRTVKPRVIPKVVQTHQRSNICDLIVMKPKLNQLPQTVQGADIVDLVVVEVEPCQAGEPAQDTDVVDLVAAEA